MANTNQNISMTDNLHTLTKEYFSKVEKAFREHPTVESIVNDADDNTLKLARQIGVSIAVGFGIFALQRIIENPSKQSEESGKEEPHNYNEKMNYE